MPSPFPGMDPYLEKPGLWPDVHLGIISETQAQLNRQLLPKYHVRVEERVYISDDLDPARRRIVSDLRIAVRPGWEDRPVAPDERGGVAIAEPIVLTTLIDEEVHEARLEVIDSENQAVVTVIEILSPTNKVPGSRGRASFEAKRSEVMCSPSHWVEIDLLRAGALFPPFDALPSHHYRVHISEVRRRPKGLLWPIRLDQRLPIIPIPLREGDPPAPLDLQAVLEHAYERAAYDMVTNYRADPDPPLQGAWAEWADQLLKQKGLRDGSSPPVA